MSGRERSSQPGSFSRLRRWCRFRPRVWAGLLLLVALSLSGHMLWTKYAPVVARHPQYQITADQIHITPPPPWIRSDVKTEVLRDSGLTSRFSVLEEDQTLFRRVREAFEFHPWVLSVSKITKRLPSSLEVDLVYRRPVAAVESSDHDSVSYLPVDVMAVRLPDADLTDVERRYLPRITGVTSRPSVGDVWDDPRVLGSVRLAAGLADVWQTLRLVEIIPSSDVEVNGDARFHTFEIISSGGTRIAWGAAPGEEQVAGDSPFLAKRDRLLGFVAQSGVLDSIDGPKLLDVRRELKIVPRTARNKPAHPPGDDSQTK
jgi:hypothetical protein